MAEETKTPKYTTVQGTAESNLINEIKDQVKEIEKKLSQLAQLIKMK